ncbi:hypothetical protein B0H14DRAFT_2645793 [Mycena olivaceomarginata]|nr:hypothetical protein B0H14DRAFT_2645793 [Mycena olivaceomarginata]
MTTKIRCPKREIGGNTTTSHLPTEALQREYGATQKQEGTRERLEREREGTHGMGAEVKGPESPREVDHTTQERVQDPGEGESVDREAKANILAPGLRAIGEACTCVFRQSLLVILTPARLVLAHPWRASLWRSQSPLHAAPAAHDTRPSRRTLSAGGRWTCVAGIASRQLRTKPAGRSERPSEHRRGEGRGGEERRSGRRRCKQFDARNPAAGGAAREASPEFRQDGDGGVGSEGEGESEAYDALIMCAGVGRLRRPVLKAMI